MKIITEGMRVYTVRGLVAYQPHTHAKVQTLRVHATIESIGPAAAIQTILDDYINGEFLTIPIVNDVSSEILDLSMCALHPCVNQATIVLDNDAYKFGCCEECADRMSDMNSENAVWISAARAVAQEELV